MATVDDKKIIFSMVGVSKIIPQNQKQILKNIYLSFFYGAKIGIIGLNGAGKSTLMKIIAGLEQPTQGEVVGAQATLWATCLRILRSTRTRP
jgi:sulfate-transporting ATPase